MSLQQVLATKPKSKNVTTRKASRLYLIRHLRTYHAHVSTIYECKQSTSQSFFCGFPFPSYNWACLPYIHRTISFIFWINEWTWKILMKKPSMMYTSSLTFSHFTHAIGFQSMAQSQTQRARCFQTCLIGLKKTQYVSIPITRPFPFFVPKLWWVRPF